MLSIYQEGEKEPNLENILGKFNENAASVVPVKPNIKMSIRSNQRVMKNNRAKRSAKMLRCEGKLVNKNGKLVPEVKCSTQQVELPKSEKLQTKSTHNNQTHLLADILSEVSKSKKDPQEDEVDKLFPREVNNENENLFSRENNLNLNNNTNNSSRRCSKRKRSRKPNQNNNQALISTPKKKTKRKYRTIQMNLSGEAPVIPNVAIKRKRRTKRAKGNKKNSTPSSPQKPKPKTKSKSK